MPRCAQHYELSALFAVDDGHAVSDASRQYVNRLSDLLFVMARRLSDLPENRTSYGSMTSPLDQNSARSGQRLGFLGFPRLFS